MAMIMAMPMMNGHGQVAAQHRNLGDQHADEQHDAVARAGIEHQRKDDAEPGFHGVTGRPLYSWMKLIHSSTT